MLHILGAYFSNLVPGKFAKRAKIVQKSVKIVFDERFKIVAVFSDKIDRFLTNFFMIRLGAGELHLEDRQLGHARRTLAENSLRKCTSDWMAILVRNGAKETVTIGCRFP